MTSTAIDFPNNRSQLDPTLNNPPFTDIPLENGDVFIAAGSSYTWAQDNGEAYGRWKNEDPGATGDGRYVRLQDDGGTQVINGGGVLSINDNIFLNGTSGNITLNGTVDGRDVAADGTKLDGIEAGADVSQWSDVTGGINYADGNVGIGTTSPATKLSNSASSISDGTQSVGSNAFNWSSSNANAYIAGIRNNSTGNGLLVQVGDDNPARKIIYAQNNSGDPVFLARGDGNVGIGTSSPTRKLEIKTGTGIAGFKPSSSSLATTLEFLRNGAGTSSNNAIEVSNSNGIAAQIDYGGGAYFAANVGIGTTVPNDKLEVNGNIRFTAAGQGINFNNYGNGAAIDSNLLDDYEEGTWTPAMTGALTYSYREGQYTKIGRLVTIQCRIQVATFTSSAAGIEVTGLPFTTGSNTNLTGFGGAYFTFGNLFSDSTDASYRWHAPLGLQKLQLRGGNTSTAGVAVNFIGIAYTKQFILSGSYYTD